MAAPVQLPPNLKQLNSYLKLAKEYDKIDPTVAYFCRMFAVQKGIKLDSKSPDCKKFLFSLMDQLENTKKALLESGEEAVSNEIVGQAHIESVTLSLFSWADSADRNGVFNRNITKAFYSASLLFDVLGQFDGFTEECQIKQKYAKWKATYLHKCLQNGVVPEPGPEGSGFENELNVLPDVSKESKFNSQIPPSNNADSINFATGYSSAPASYGFAPPEVSEKPVPVPRKVLNATDTSPQNPSVSDSSSSDIDFIQATKFCKFAMSALQYEDVGTAVENLTKALNLLQKR
ncbi:vacuolar protein sorting-associated protein VTA1 homolog [Hydra vulgaris]|uniref:Vacuolar protein sorting-associated protein VTA1 homolog n=1 Tax=Hydra vulgaris TaxID=6087 RepID=A0ABM4BW82_HYDVU